MKSPFLIGISALLLALSSAQAKNKCSTFEVVNFSSIKVSTKNAQGKEIPDYPIERAQISDYELDAGDTPAKISNSKKRSSCQADVAIVQGNKDVFWAKDSDRVLYHSYSGSQQWFTLVDMKSCKTLWKSRSHLGGKIEDNLIKIKSDCGECEETNNFAGICRCQAAEVWKLSTNCQLVHDKAASKELTKDNLNVAFTGTKKVKSAKSESAKIIK